MNMPPKIETAARPDFIPKPLKNASSPTTIPKTPYNSGFILFSLCITKLKTAVVRIRSKEFSFGFILTDDLLQQADVFRKGFAARSRERAGGERTILLVGFGDGDEALLPQRADVRGEIAVRHVQGVAQFGEGKLRRGCERRHDGQSALLVNHAIELEK